MYSLRRTGLCKSGSSLGIDVGYGFCIPLCGWDCLVETDLSQHTGKSHGTSSREWDCPDRLSGKTDVGPWHSALVYECAKTDLEKILNNKVHSPSILFEMVRSMVCATTTYVANYK
jgi:hypothetical protein